VATGGAGGAEVLRKKHLAESRRLGIVGLCSQAPTEIYGAIAVNFWEELTVRRGLTGWQNTSDRRS
jgi:hypothetical protein